MSSMPSSSRLLELFLVLAMLAAAGCRQDMRNQAKHKALSTSEFYEDDMEESLDYNSSDSETEDDGHDEMAGDNHWA